MMRAWENRIDTEVLDEPFYGAYLASTGLDHPMREEILTHCPTHWDTCARLCAETGEKAIHYQKHMCQHMINGAPRDWMASVRHAFLIRPPEAVAASFHKGWPGMGAEDLGFRRQAELFDHICQMVGAVPPVLEARDVLENPEGKLRLLCRTLGVDFNPAMLCWPTGRRASDGVWGAHWYGRVESSTGFTPYRPHDNVAEELKHIVETCRPYYEAMYRYRL